MAKNFNALRNVSAIFNLSYLWSLDAYGLHILVDQKQNCHQ